MNEVLRRCLDDLESRIDPAQEVALLGQWRDFSNGRFKGGVFFPSRTRAGAPGVKWPRLIVNDTLADFDAMLLQQYAICSDALAAASGAPLTVRANYGTSIIALLFGVEPFVMPVETNTLPTSVPLHSADAVRRLVDAGAPNLDAGYGARVFETGERFAAIAREYPRIGRYVHVYHPDLQGPLDICEVVWGSEIFIALYDCPELVKELLELVTETYIAFMHRWAKIAPFHKEGNAHWDIYHGGSLMLRNDSSMNISGDHYEEFVRPYEQRLLDEFGGGAVHFCGRGDHYIGRMSRMRGLTAVHLGQAECNDMEVIYTNTVDRGINLLGVPVETAEPALKAGRDLHGRVHCRNAPRGMIKTG